jgi:hypothetical protein
MAEAAIIPIVLKRAVLATWQSVNPVLKWGEVGVIIAENGANGFVQAVIGDGANDFNDLFNNNKVFLTWADLLQNKITPIVETLLDLIDDEAALRAAGDNGNAAAIAALTNVVDDLGDALAVDENNLEIETDARTAADENLQAQIDEINLQIQFINGAVVYVGSVAGEDIAAGDLLVIDETGTLFKYDYTNPDHRYAVIGLAMTAQGVGEPLNVIMFGIYVAESNLFSAGSSIFASQDTPGALVFALPDGPYSVQVGYSINDTVALVSVINSQINSYLEALIEAETAERIAVVADEEAARILADGIEETTREAADIDLQLNIDAEEAARIAADATKQDTLVSGTNIKSLNGASLLGAGNFVLKSYSDYWVGAAGLNPGDGTTLYFGQVPAAPQATTTQRRSLYFNRAGTIVSCIVGIHSTVAGTGEAWSLYIRKNDITDYLVATVSNTNILRMYSNTALNIPIVAGDFIEMKLVNPTWATNPTGTFIGGHLTLES